MIESGDINGLAELILRQMQTRIEWTIQSVPPPPPNDPGWTPGPPPTDLEIVARFVAEQIALAVDAEHCREIGAEGEFSSFWWKRPDEYHEDSRAELREIWNRHVDLWYQ